MTDLKNLQFSLDFDPSKATSLIEEVHRAIAVSGKQRKYIAADMEITEAELSNKLHGVDNRDIGLRKLEMLLDSLGDAATIPVKYLAFKYLASREDQKAIAAKALSEFTDKLPMMIRFAEMLTEQEKGRKK